MKLPDFIKAARKAKKLTVRDIELRADGLISHPYYSQVENGNIKDPSIRKLIGIAKALDLEPMLLLQIAVADIES